MHRPVIRARHHHPVRVDSQTIDNGIVAGQILDELALRTLPLFDVVGPGRGKHVELGMKDKAAHRFLVVGEGGHGLAGRQVPQANCRVITCRDNL